jgi:TRAP-type mannitol/chloroaromatic compound transport system substrate-binding protein
MVSEIARTKSWLTQDQRGYWEKQMKLRARELERAQAELFSARLSLIQNVSAAQEMDVHRAQRAIREAEEKLRTLKKWERELENRSAPMIKEIDQLHSYLTTDMSRAVAYLTEIIKSLQSYAESRGSPAGAPSPDLPPADASNPSPTQK